MGDIPEDQSPAPAAQPSSAFDPPCPPEESAIATAATIAAGFGIVAVDVLTGGVLASVAAIPSWDSPQPMDLAALQQRIPGLAQTAPPQVTADQKVVCTQCAVAVPFASMSLNEHGYFCARCAASIPEFEAGVDSYVRYAGGLKDTLGITLAKIRSTMCNCGALSIPELNARAGITLASAVSIREGAAHDVILKDTHGDRKE